MNVNDCTTTVLLVEDDQDLRDAIADTLENVGYRVKLASNGREALAALRGASARPCVILLDLMMPVMDGWQFREEQRKDPALSSIPVVVLSAHANLWNFDAAAHLKKPVDIHPLVDTVAQFCEPAASQ